MGQRFSHHNAKFTLDIIGEVNHSDISILEQDVSNEVEQSQDDEKKILKMAITAYIQLRDICLCNLEAYRNQSCEDLLKEAISNPNDQEIQDFTYASLISNIQLINQIYDTCQDIKEDIGKILTYLSQNGVREKQEVAKVFAYIIEICLRCDTARILQPSIQQEFSYFKRYLPKYKDYTAAQFEEILKKGRSKRSIEKKNSQVNQNENKLQDLQLPMDSTKSNTVGLFLIDPRLFSNLIEHSMDLSGGNSDRQKVCQVFSDLSNSMYKIIRNTNIKFKDKDNSVPTSPRNKYITDNLSRCYGMMVASTILYDRIHPKGAFCKGSLIRMQKVVHVLSNSDNITNSEMKEEKGNVSSSTPRLIQQSTIDSLINSLKYSSLHYRDESTQTFIHAAFGAN